jgi:hypothetical protein
MQRRRFPGLFHVNRSLGEIHGHHRSKFFAFAVHLLVVAHFGFLFRKPIALNRNVFLLLQSLQVLQPA